MNTKGKILIIDDNEDVLFALNLLLDPYVEKIKVTTQPTRIEHFMTTFQPDVILLDMNFRRDAISGQEGFDCLEQILKLDPQAIVLFMTAYADTDKAVRAIKAGAIDFITKPWNNVALMQRIETALELTSQDKKAEVPVEDNDGFDRSHIIGKSKALMDVLATIKRIARTNASVLITGESGTGKELIAEAVHLNSPRSKKPFVKVNLGGISHTLFESEMFGHKKGAFTDATADRVGRFELADKGTIFLDEIGDLDLSCQVKLLRVLQEQTFEVLGDSRPRKVDIRVVSATNADLRQMVQEHTFREDLFYRINLITVHLPALRERREDIPLLVRHFADKQCESNGLPKVEFTSEAMDYLSRLPYPGNIRELKNLVERTLLVSGKEILTADDFKSQYQHPIEQKVTTNLQGMTLEEIEKQTILQTLEKYNNNMSQVAVALGISRAALYRRLEKYNIQVND